MPNIPLKYYLSVNGGCGLGSFPIDPDFLLQLLKCLFFGAPYLLSC